MLIQSLREYLEEQKKTRFKNININDVLALRKSWIRPEDTNVTVESDSNDNISTDSIKQTKPASKPQKELNEKNSSPIIPTIKRKRSVKLLDENEPYNIFLRNWKSKSIIPSPMGVVNKSKEVNEVIKLNEYKIGDEYASAFAQSLQSTNHNIVHLNMKNNKLTDGGAKAIIDNLKESIKTIDLSWNPKMGLKAYEWLGGKIGTTFYNLKTLNLDHNNISKRGLEILCDGITYNDSLTTLSLNHNNLENEHAFAIADLIKYSSIKILFIAWNKIRDAGGVLIFNALANNRSIQVLDASFNSFSSMSTNNFGNSIIRNEEDQEIINWCKTAGALNKMFSENSALIHVDLSHNNFSVDDWDEISKGLNKNRSVLGLHMSGNSRDTNALGFIYKKSNYDPGVAHVHTRIHQSLETWSLNSKRKEFKASSNWWIWEGWTQIEFRFIPRKSTDDIIDDFTPIYIHLEWDEYEPDLLIKNTDTGYYYVRRMVPPKLIKYFFTFGDHHIRIAKDQPVWNNHMTIADLDVHDDILISIPKLNYIEVPNPGKSLITEEFLNEMSVKPRPDPKYPPTRIRPKTPWDFNKSIFAAYKSDTPELLDQWFEIDWENSKIPKLVREEEFEIKEYLRSLYRNLREWYKYYAGISPSNQVFCISKTLFNEIINSIYPSIIDVNLTISAIDLEFITTMSGNKSGKLNPSRDLIRFQFIEIFVRLAIQKYHKSRVCKTKFESIQRFFDSDLKEFLEKI